MAHPGFDHAAFEQARLDWLAECRNRYRSHRGRTTGAVVGALVGGVAGSAIAGKGDRVVGAIAGGTLGAVAGSAIGSGSDPRRTGDYCESYLDYHLARQQHGFDPAGHGHGNGHGYMLQPVMVMMPMAIMRTTAPAAPQRECEETTVIEEWVPVTPPKRRIVPDKRIRIVPDKRISTK
jgi:hypothetical protein